jgi:hypothetical protein
MARLPNYIVDANPFKLAGPPDYWLQALWDFDASLVVMPSKMGFFYRIGQRRNPRHDMKMVDDMRKEDADARMMAAHLLVPVTTLLSTANWSQFPIHMEAMRQRMPSRMGGHEEFNKRLDAQEAEDELKKQIAQDEMLTSISKDAWGLYLKKLGLRSHMYIPKTGKSTEEKPNFSMGTKAPGIQVGSIFLP